MFTLLLLLLPACAPDDDVSACMDACDLVHVECAEHLDEPDARGCYDDCRASVAASTWAAYVQDAWDSHLPNQACSTLSASEAYLSPCYAPGTCE